MMMHSVLAAAALLAGMMAPVVPRASEAALEGSGFLPGGTVTDIEACAGPVAVVRFSAAREGGSLSGYRDAMMAHAAWAHSYGDTDLTFRRFHGRLGASTVPQTALAGGEAREGAAADDGGRFVFGSMLIYPSWSRALDIWGNRRASEARPGAQETFMELYEANTDGFTAMTLCLEDMGGVAAGI